MSESSIPAGINTVLNYFSDLNPISPGFIKEICNHSKIINVRKNKYVLSPLELNEAVYFIVSGIVRGFIKDEDRDITTWISMGNEFVDALKHPSDQSAPSIEYLQALEECELVVIPNGVIDKLYRNYPETNVIGRKILAAQYQRTSESSVLARIPSADRRYEWFIEKASFDINKVPLRCVASYLGMRLETLSRIRNKSVSRTVAPV